MGLMLPPKNQNGITDELQAAFGEATPFEVRLATAMLYHPTREAALDAIKADANLINDKQLWRNIDKLNSAISKNLMYSAIPMMQQYLPQAIQVLMGGLGSTNEKVRLQTAKVIIERFLGKPTTHAKIDMNARQETVVYNLHGITPEMLDISDDTDFVEGEYSTEDFST